MTKPDDNIPVKKPIKKKKIKNPMIEEYDENELAYYKQLADQQKRKVAHTETAIIEANQVKVPLRFKILLSDLDEKLKAIAIQKLNYLYTMDSSSSEYYKTASWIENVCKIPFGIYKSLPVTHESDREHVKDFLNTVKANLDSRVYGHNEAKDQIIRLLAQWIVNPKGKGMVIGIHGPHGCGKTTLIKDGICEVIGLPFAFIPLGGASDGCYLDGHSFTYSGSTWGKTVDVLMKSGCMNPVLFFDELDKVSNTHKGQEIINYLIHLTDATQNERVNDKFFADFEFDLSRSLIIFSYNDPAEVNPILKDRMVTIETKGYNITDKIVIAKKHMIPELLKEYGFKPNEIEFCDDVIRQVIQACEDERGVRNLRRGLVDIISNMNLRRLFDEKANSKVKAHDVTLYLGKNKEGERSVSQLMMYI